MCKIVTRLEKHVFLQEFAQELKTLWEIGPWFPADTLRNHHYVIITQDIKG